MIKKVHVVGAGIAGLSAAYFLRRHGFEVRLYEASSHVGGLIGTQKTKYGIAESGAHAFMNSTFLEELCTEIGVTMTPATALSKKFRFLESRLEVTRWPLGILESLRFIWGVITVKFRPPKPFESVYHWSRRVFGRGAATKLISKVLQGIYAADTKSLSASLIFSRLYKRPTFGKKPKIRGSVAPLEGMQAFIDKLLARFQDLGGTLFQNAPVDESKIRSWVESEEMVVLAVPIWTAANLLKSVDTEIAADFAAVPSLPLEATTVFWDAPNTAPLRPGFGVLFERKNADDPMLGVLQNDKIFAQRVWGEGVSSETWITSGSVDPLSELQIKRRSLMGAQSHARMLDSMEILWPKSIPLFGQNLEFAFREDFSTKLATRGIYLVGNYMGEIGVAKIIERSYRLVQSLARKDAVL